MESASTTVAQILVEGSANSPASSPDLVPPPVTTLDEIRDGAHSVIDRIEEPSCPENTSVIGNSSEPVPASGHVWSPSYNPKPWGRAGDLMSSNFMVSSSATEILPTGVGAGLRNLGNTCFLNAILQCFTHTVPLVQGLRALNHVRTLCQRGKEGFCTLCVLCGYIEDSLSSSGHTIEPVDLVDNLSNISSCFGRYQQEDAHEFLQCLLDKLETCLNSKTYDGMSSKNNKLVERVFGGRLLSKLRCCNCSYFSSTYEPIIDLSLEIGDVDNLPSALESFTKVETIEDTETQFTCENCKEKVTVEKQLVLDKPPAVAAFHLKRFKADGSSVVKIDKHVTYPLELDLNPYASSSHNNNDGLKYELYAVVVHVGPSPSSGHYFCFIRSSPNTWHRMDDSRVYRVREDFVLSQDAYILFYAKQGTPWFSTLMESQKTSTSFSPTILNKSPKSVLDLAEDTFSPGTVKNDSCKDNKTPGGLNIISMVQHVPWANATAQRRDAPEGNETAKLSSEATQAQELLHCNESRSDVYATNNTSATCAKSSTIYEKTNFLLDEGDLDVFHIVTPPSSPSPDKSHDKRIRSEERFACKKQLSKELDDTNTKKGEERKEAIRYLSKYKGPCSRREMLLAAAMRGNEESKTKKRRMKVSPAKDGHGHKSRQRTVVG